MKKMDGNLFNDISVNKNFRFKINMINVKKYHKYI